MIDLIVCAVVAVAICIAALNARRSRSIRISWDEYGNPESIEVHGYNLTDAARIIGEAITRRREVEEK